MISKPALCVLSDRRMFVYLLVLLDSLKNCIHKFDVVFGDMGMTATQIRYVSGIGKVVNIGSDVLNQKIYILKAVSKTHENVLYLDADMLALNDPSLLFYHTDTVGAAPDCVNLDHSGKNLYFSDRQLHYDEVAKMFGIDDKAFRALNCGLLVLKSSVNFYATEMERILRRLHDSNIPFGSFGANSGADQLALVVYRAMHPFKIVPVSWDVPPDPAFQIQIKNDGYYWMDEKVNMIHYMGGQRPGIEEYLMRPTQTGLCNEQDSLLIRLWKERLDSILKDIKVMELVATC
jgi:hypothetical protein